MVSMTQTHTAPITNNHNNAERPTVAKINDLISEMFAGHMRIDLDTGALIDPDAEGSRLTAEVIHEAWATIVPDDNDGAITDPVEQVMMGATLSDLWTTR